MKRIALVLVFIMMLSLVAGCNSTTTTTGNNSSSTTTTAATKQKVIKIGMPSPLTGSIAVTGEYAKMGAKIFEQEVAAAGGIKIGGEMYSIEFIWGDNEGKPEMAVNIFEKLINQDKVDAIVNTDASKDLIAAGPVAQAAGVPVIGSTTTNDKVTQVGDYIFRACFIDSYQGVAGAQYAIDTLKAKTAAILYSNADDYALGLAASFEKAFTEKGGTIIAKESYAGADTKDYNAQITSIKNAGTADVIWMPNNFGEIALQIIQIKQAGLKSQLFGPDSWDNPDIAKLAGAENAAGCLHLALFSPESPDARIKAFVAKFKENEGADKRPTGNAYLTYESLLLFKYAWETAGTLDKVKVRDTLAAIKNLDLPSGSFSYDANRNPQKGAFVMQIQPDGNSVYKDIVVAK